MYLIKVTSLLLVLTFVSGQGFTNYDGFKIYEVIPTSRQEADFLYDLSSKNAELDVFKLTKLPYEPAHIMVPPKEQYNFEQSLISNGMDFNVINKDVSKSVLSEKIENFGQPKNILEKFYTYDEINNYLDDVARKFSSNVQLEVLGNSYEGKPIKAVKITNGQGGDKKVIFVDAGIHAREWIAPSTALYMIDQLTSNYEANKDLLVDYDWVIVPILNVDGYIHSHKSYRMWRKTRKPSSSSCYGTDGNRNFDFHWGETGASSQPCSDTFKGQTPFSEPETQFIRDQLLKYSGKAKFYLTLHSYGNYLLYPWGWTSKLPENVKDLDEVAQAGASAIKAATGGRYTVGSSTNVLYAAAGGSDDWALGVAKIPCSVTMELPSGGMGFEPRPSQIKEMVTESWVGIRAMAKKVIEKY